jgi:hypothetical protein
MHARSIHITIYTWFIPDLEPDLLQTVDAGSTMNKPGGADARAAGLIESTCRDVYTWICISHINI